MTGQDYEFAAARYLRWHGYHAVRVTKASGDYGVDITCTRHSIRYAVQCKYFTKPVGLSAVQQAVAGKAQYGCEAAMVVTNNVLTKAARQLAQSNDVVVLEQVEPRQLMPRTLALFLRVLLKVLWLAVMIWSCRQAWQQTGGKIAFPIPVCWHLPLLLIAVPVAWQLVSMLLRSVLWRAAQFHTRHRQERTQRMEQRDLQDLERCRTIAKAMSMQTYPAQAFEVSNVGASTQRVMDIFPKSVLMKTVLKAVGRRRSFSMRKLSRLTDLTPEAARTLVDCLVQAGMLVCTRPSRYAWSRMSYQ